MIKSNPLAEEKTRRGYLELFAAEGIGPERIELVPWIPSLSGHLGAYSRIDIALDTFPYNGTTTTCEALWMGVPVIALRGDRHAARVGHSLLAAVGLPEFAAPSKPAYVEAAVGLANDLGRLTALRSGLRERLRSSPLGDADAFARNVETAYRNMWRTWCNADPLPQAGEGRGPR
jgi:predicted O-linked N-acetylglucosamine transferase (SPINDLY family)